MVLFRNLILSLLLTSFLNASGKETKEEWAKYYKDYKGRGCFVLYDLNNDKYYIYNEKRANEGFSPASTFKIPNSLIAIETGAVKDENEIIKWDGKDRGREAWNKDHSMRSAIQVSAVWFYQEMARRIGSERMQHYIDSIGYGNKDIRDNIDDFWLKGKIRITPVEQIKLLVKLYTDSLPFSQRTMDIVKDILINEKTADYTLRAKTGWGFGEVTDIGWWVGYIETKDNVYFFANNMDMVDDADGRVEAAKNILREMEIYP